MSIARQHQRRDAGLVSGTLPDAQAVAYVQLQHHHRRVATPAFSSCMACGVSWPCEVGQALEIIEALMQT
jgi:hypothetical protein